MPRIDRLPSRPLTATLAATTLVLGLAATPALALDAAQIEAGARRAPVGVREITTRLAAEDFEGRNNLTEGSLRAQDYLIGLLREIGPGVSGESDDEAYKHPFAQGTNLVAIIRGRELPDEYVMIGGHYDHLGVSQSTGRVFNGASDNATGTAVAVAVGRAIRSLPEPPRRSIAIVLWDAEEDGLLGSLAWVRDPAIPIENTVAYVNLDIQGVNLTPGLSRTSFAVGGETGGTALQDTVAAAVEADARSFARAVDTLPISYIFGQLRSDYANLVNAGVPTVFFSDSTGACYHTTADDVRNVDFDKLASQTRIAYRTTMALAEADETLPFIAPNPQLAVYEDAVTLNTVYTRARSDLNRFSAANRRVVQDIAANVAAIVERGPDAFTSEDAGVLLEAAATTISLLETLECGGYFGRRGPYLVPGERDPLHQHGTRPPVAPRRLPLTRR